MTWRVVHESAFNDWREFDESIRDQMLEWFFELVASGPPENLRGYPADLDPSGDIRIAIAPTGNLVEMLIFGDTDPPMIAVVGIRERPRS